MNATTARFQALAAQARGALSSPDSDAVETRALARAFWRRRWMIAAVSLVAGVVVWVAMQQVEPTYTAYSKVMLDVRKAQIVGDNKVVKDVDPSKQIVNSEIAVLRSNLVIGEMLTRLSPAQLDQLDPALQPKPLLSRVKGAVKGLVTSAPEPRAPEDEAAARQTRITGAVRGMRRIYAEPDSYVMVMRVDSGDPVLSRDIANNLADAYIGLQLDNRREAVGRATTWLEQRLGELRLKVEETERAVANFRAESLLQDGGTLEVVSQQLADLNTELGTTHATRLEVEARLDQLQTVLAEDGIDAAAAIVDTPTMQALAAQQLELTQSEAVWARSFNESHPKRVEIRTELAEIRAVMQAELENAIAVQRSELAVARDREAGLSQNIATLEGKVLDMTENQLGLRQLDREAEAARQTYEALLIRISEARAQKELQQPDSVMVERAAAPAVPSAPRPTLLATLAMTVTGALVSAWILFNEMTPTTFRATREIEAATGLPVLTALPVQDWKDTSDMLADLRNDAYSRYAERIRQLRTALTMRKRESGRGQSVMILASAPGEGKTTTALALTEMAVLAGRSAIIVDCDLRRPKVLASLGVSRPGRHDFADFIEDKCDLPDAIHSPKGVKFDVLAARKPRRSAADALSVTWLGPVLRELERAYDIVVVDAPALLAVPDALVPAQEVDTRFYLVSFDETPRAAVQRGLATLAELGIGIRGMILNKVDPARAPGAIEEGYGYEY